MAARQAKERKKESEQNGFTITSNDKKPRESDYETAHLRAEKQRGPRSDEQQYVTTKAGCTASNSTSATIWW